MSTQQRKEMQEKYGWFYKTLVQLLATYDFMGLTSSGAPSNEYDIEAAMVLARIDEANSPDSLAYLIDEYFLFSDQRLAFLKKSRTRSIC